MASIRAKPEALKVQILIWIQTHPKLRDVWTKALGSCPPPVQHENQVGPTASRPLLLLRLLQFSNLMW